MNIRKDNEKEFITVVPYSNSTREQRIRIYKLCFWYEDQYTHEIDLSNIQAFLKKVQLLGATIFPDQPTAGCFAWESELRTEAGELPVFKIIYNNEIVYSMNEARSRSIIAVTNHRIK